MEQSELQDCGFDPVFLPQGQVQSLADNNTETALDDDKWEDIMRKLIQDLDQLEQENKPACLYWHMLGPSLYYWALGWYAQEQDKVSGSMFQYYGVRHESIDCTAEESYVDVLTVESSLAMQILHSGNSFPQGQAGI